jgi:hypothetical protein
MVERTAEGVNTLIDRFSDSPKGVQRDLRSNYPIPVFTLFGVLCGMLDVSGITDKGWKEIEKVEAEL